MIEFCLKKADLEILVHQKIDNTEHTHTFWAKYIFDTSKYFRYLYLNTILILIGNATNRQIIPKVHKMYQEVYFVS